MWRPPNVRAGGRRVPPASAPLSASTRRNATLALLLVCLGVLVLHAVLVGLDRPINWDEAVHVSQVDPHRPAVFLEPHRTRGLSLLVAPVAVFGPSMVVLRAYLLLAGVVGLFVAFRTWVPTVGWGAPVAAALYSTYWVTIFYSVEVLPNHPAALLSVGAAGLVARAVSGAGVAEDGWQAMAWKLAAVFAVFAMLRPPDAVVVGLALGIVLLALRGAAALRPVLLAGAGGLAGLLPWLLEGWVRFGLGPVQTVRSASEYSVGGPSVNKLPLYLRSLEDQLRCARPCMDRFVEDGGGWQLPPVRTSAFLLVALALTVVALAAGPRVRRAIAAPLLAGAGLVGLYGLGGGAMNLRYLVPAYALLLLAPAIGGCIVWRRLSTSPRAQLARGAIVVLLGLTSLWQLHLVAERFEGPATRDRAAALGAALDDVAGDDCVVVTDVNYPQIQYWSGCLAVQASEDPDTLQPPLGALGSYVDVNAHARRGAQVFAIADEELDKGSPLRGWEVVAPEDEPIRGRRLYEHVAGAPLPPPPCPDDREATRTLVRRLSADC